jgi:tyrosyl-tRNA synthetase
MRDVAEQLQILRRGVDSIVPEGEFLGMLERSTREGTPLRVKYGIDPTGINVHLGQPRSTTTVNGSRSGRSSTSST